MENCSRLLIPLCLGFSYNTAVVSLLYLRRAGEEKVALTSLPQQDPRSRPYELLLETHQRAVGVAFSL